MTPRSNPGITARIRRLLEPLLAPRVLVPTVLGVLFLGFAGIGLAVGSWRNVCATCPSVAQIRTWEPEQTSKLFAADGALITELGMQRRTPVSLDALPEYVPQAVVSIEDRRFYSHWGIDPRGLARAALSNATGGPVQGGSTITQQLAKFTFLTSERSLIRKAREVLIAFWLEAWLTKQKKAA